MARCVQGEVGLGVVDQDPWETHNSDEASLDWDDRKVHAHVLQQELARVGAVFNVKLGVDDEHSLRSTISGAYYVHATT